MSWKQVLTALLKAMATQGGVWSWVASYLIGLIDQAGTEVFPIAFESDTRPSAAPPEFKDAVRKKLLEIVSGVSRPFVRIALTMMINQLSDEILDRAWDFLFGPAVITVSVDEVMNALLTEIGN